MKDKQLDWAVKQVRGCRRLSLPLFENGDFKLRRKADDSPVTLADVRIEAHLRTALGRAYGGDAIMGEEYANPKDIPQSYWTIDPIDGTRAFGRGLPFWGTLLGRVERGRAVLGVCDYPALNITLFASQSAGAFIREGNTVKALVPLRGRTALNRAVILHGGSSWWRGTPYAAGFDAISGQCYLERAYGDCYAYLWLFRGLADAVVEYGLALWDIVPLAAIAKAVGMRVYGPDAKEGFDGAFSVVSRPALGKRLAQILSGDSQTG